MSYDRTSAVEKASLKANCRRHVLAVRRKLKLDSNFPKPWLTRRRGPGYEISLLDRFWEKVDVREVDECWPWMAATDDRGYGNIQAGKNGSLLRATHVALSTIGIKVPKGKCALHSCDHPLCVNPKHLRVGTKLDNARDMTIRRRWSDRRGESNARSKLTRLDIPIIIAMRDFGCTLEMIAKSFGITFANVWQITTGRTWK